MCLTNGLSWKKISGQHFRSKKGRSPAQDDAGGRRTCASRLSITAPPHPSAVRGARPRGSGTFPDARVALTRGHGRELVWTKEANFLVTVGADGRGRRSSHGGRGHEKAPPHPPRRSFRKPAPSVYAKRHPGAPALCWATSGCQLVSLVLRPPRPEGLRRGACSHRGPCTPTAAGAALPRRGPSRWGR